MISVYCIRSDGAATYYVVILNINCPNIFYPKFPTVEITVLLEYFDEGVHSIGVFDRCMGIL